MKSLQGGGFLVSPDHKFSGPMVTFLYPDCRLKFISAPGHFDFDFILQAMMQIFFLFLRTVLSGEFNNKGEMVSAKQAEVKQKI